MSSNRYRLSKMKALSLQNLNEIDKTEWKSNYDIKTKEIGRGHFSKVYHIVCKSTSKAFAAKVIRRRRSGRDLIDKIRREADLIKQLNEANVDAVIRMHKSYENFSEIILILELANGGSVYSLVDDSESGLDQCYTREVIRKVLEALSKCHDDNIVHLDIKADNILLREPYPSTNVAICDFGLAIQLKDGVKHKEIVGTPDYMAPETISYEEISVSADMWSMGVLVYFMLTKVSPFIGSSKDNTLHNVSRAVIPFISKFSDPDFQMAQSLISSLCVRNPQSRLSASEALSHAWFELDSIAPLPVTSQDNTETQIKSPVPISIKISPPEDNVDGDVINTVLQNQDDATNKHSSDQETVFEWDQEKITLKNRCPSLVKIPTTPPRLSSLVISSASWKVPRFSLTPKLNNINEYNLSDNSSLSIDETVGDGKLLDNVYQDETKVNISYHDNGQIKNYCHDNSKPIYNDYGNHQNHNSDIGDHIDTSTFDCNATGDKVTTQLPTKLAQQCNSSGDIISQDYVNIHIDQNILSCSGVNINSNHSSESHTNPKYSSSQNESYVSWFREACHIL